MVSFQIEVIPFIFYSNKNENSTYLKATFVYDNVLYIFTGKNMSKYDLVNYINGLEF